MATLPARVLCGEKAIDRIAVLVEIQNSGHVSRYHMSDYIQEDA
jgi:hypothetical protein